MYEVEECVKGQLKKQLNSIEERGGEIRQIIEGTRKDFVMIVWMREGKRNVYADPRDQYQPPLGSVRPMR